MRIFKVNKCVEKNINKIMLYEKIRRDQNKN